MNSKAAHDKSPAIPGLALRGPANLFGAAALALASLVSGCTSQSTAAERTDENLTFPVAALKASDTHYEREYVGEVHAVRYAEIRSRLKGVIESLAVDEGQSVKADQLLFSIRATELQQELLKARAAQKSADAELSLARMDLENTKLLFEKNVVSNAELALSQSKVDAVAAKLDESRANANQTSISLAYAQVKAPFDGTINRIANKSGSLVDEDALLTTITDSSAVFVYFRLSEREYMEYSAVSATDQVREVALKLADGSLHPHTGLIDAVESEINKETGTLALRARFPNPDGTLKHGSSGKVVIKTDVRGALSVPQKSTFEIQGNLYVYALDADNRVRAQQIVPKLRLGDAFVIASGLAPDDRFILEGVQKVKEGIQIVPVPAS